MCSSEEAKVFMDVSQSSGVTISCPYVTLVMLFIQNASVAIQRPTNMTP